VQLGKLKVMCQGNDAFYWGPKFYRIGDHVVSNVIRPNARQVAEGLFLQAARDGPGTTIRTGVLDRVIVRDRLVHAWFGSDVDTQIY
jgi:hypothetical protein